MEWMIKREGKSEGSQQGKTLPQAWQHAALFLVSDAFSNLQFKHSKVTLGD